MRQSDGSEILGPNDPRTMVIGIIHVAPSDDRQSVLTAISTQEKLGRDQIVLELPEQNKALKSAVDFEGLRKMANEIEAAIVLVAPPRSKIATYAKKEQFTLYPSLEALTTAEFPPLQSEQTTQATPAEDDVSDHTRIFPIALPETLDAQTNTPPALPETPSTSPKTTTTRTTKAKASGTTTSTRSSKTKARATAQPSQPVPATSTPSAGEPESEDTVPLPEVEADEAPTNPGLTAVAAPANTQPAPPEDTPPSITIDATGGQGNAVPATLTPNSGALIPAESGPPVFYYAPDPAQQRPHFWRGVLITSGIVLLIIVLLVVFNRPLLDLLFPPTATVTITPDSQRFQQAYQITAVLGLPNPTNDEVDARAVYASSQPQSKPVQTTGQGYIPGTSARGTLVFSNISTSPQMIPAGTVMFDPHNSHVVVVNDHTLMLPPFSTPPQTVTDSAHTLNVGSDQNIARQDFSNTPCCGGTVYVTNASAFSGGQDPQTFTYVQQGDIDGAAHNLEATLNSQATHIVQSQTRPNERAVGQPICTPQVSSDHLAGERVSTVMVTVTMNCVGEVYDLNAAQALATDKLMQDASKHFGPAYAPVGNVVAQVVRATPGFNGDISLTVNALGEWVYQFSSSQRLAMIRAIAGHDSQDARALLLRQPGVHDVNITLTGAGATTVPSNVARITLSVTAVPGLHT